MSMDRVLPGRSARPTATTLSRGGDVEFLAVPGILARSNEQLEPLMPTLKRRNLTVVGFDYGEVFDANESAKTVAQLVRSNMSIDRRTILFGSSLGGRIVANALRLLEPEFDEYRLRLMVPVIIVDSPARSQDLVLAPPLSGSINPAVGKMLRGIKPSEKSNSGYGKRLLKMFMVPPKDHEIELTNGGPTTEQLKQAAVQGLSGHLVTGWMAQLKWMLSTQMDLGHLSKLNATYMACTNGNVTVRQPQAKEAWRPFVDQVVDVDTPHCAYLQAQASWSNSLNHVLRSFVRV